MLQVITVVAFLATVAFAGTVRIRLPGRIVGGEEVTIEEVPHQISIQQYGDHHCGGSIISKNWVLTAAHCLNAPIEAYTINAGSRYSQKPGSIHHVSKIISHTGFPSENGAFNDVALIRVEEPFEFDKTRQPVEIFADGEESPVGALAVVSGWGVLEDGTRPEILNLARVPIISKARCGELYSNQDVFEAGQICAGYDNGGKDACTGDSGGPLTVNGRLAGIVSWAEGCALPRKPGVYTEIAYFHTWIKSAILESP